MHWRLSSLAVWEMLKSSEMGGAVPMRRLLLWAILFAFSSAAFGLENKDGTYFCTVKFGGGIAYDRTMKRWKGTSFRPSGNFFVRLRYLKTRTMHAGEPYSYKLDDYLVFLNKEGEEFSVLKGGCYDNHHGELQDPGMDEYGFLSCSAGLTDYQFNFKTNRFIAIYTVGYVGGQDVDSDTPSISGGVCSKISGGQGDEKLLDLLQQHRQTK
jgi:hypothetical protein